MEQTNLNEPQKNSDSEMTLKDLVTKQLSPEAKESFEQLTKQVAVFFEDTKTYMRENPREAAVIGVAAGLTAWTLFSTRPGRKIFALVGIALMPRLKDWFSKTFTTPAASSADANFH